MKKTAILFLALLCLFLTGCESSQLSAVSISVTPVPTRTPPPMPTADPYAQRQDTLKYYKNAAEWEGHTILFSLEDGFYGQDMELTLTSEGAADIFYTDDGSEPGPYSIHYTHPIPMTAVDSHLPRGFVIRAAAYYTNGTKSPVFTHVYFLGKKIDQRFAMPVFSIVAPPEELTQGPGALLTGERALSTAPDASRDIYLQSYLPDGQKVIDQPARLRVAGNASRTMPVKSLQLEALDSEGISNSQFMYPFFGTGTTDDEHFTGYPQLVLSNSEDDFQYAFIRDELAQTIAENAGFPDTEDVAPAVVYINGEYYGLHWLHSSYDSFYFQNQYGASEEQYILLESQDHTIHSTGTDGDGPAEEFQSSLEKLLASANAADFQEQLAAFVDAENYLDYCALNIYMDNKDWPGSMLLYSLPSQENPSQHTPWRFLPHDMDQAFGLNAGEDAAQYDTFEDILSPESPRYDPLFARLMEHPGYRNYFVGKMKNFLAGAFSAKQAQSTFDSLHGQRKAEMNNYLTRLDSLRNVYNSKIWMQKKNYEEAISSLQSFLQKRPEAMEEMLRVHFPDETGSQ